MCRFNLVKVDITLDKTKLGYVLSVTIEEKLECSFGRRKLFITACAANAFHTSNTARQTFLQQFEYSKSVIY